MVRIAVLGCGRIGRMHAANIAAHPRARSPACSTSSVQRQKTWRKRSACPCFDTAEAVFASADVDAVLIATSTPTRMSDLIEAAVGGRQAGALREADRPQPRPRQRLRRAHPRHGGADHARLRAPLRPRASRRARRRFGTGEIGELHQVIDHLARSGPRARGLPQGVGRHLPRHDDPRFRHGPLHPGRGDRDRLRRRQPPGRPGLMAELDDYDTVTVVMVTDERQAVRSSTTPAAPPTATTSESRRFGTGGMAVSENRARQQCEALRRRLHRQGRAPARLLHRALSGGLRRRDRRLRRRDRERRGARGRLRGRPAWRWCWLKPR